MILNLKFHSVFFSPILYACSVSIEGSENLKKQNKKLIALVAMCVNLVALMCIGKILQLELKAIV